MATFRITASLASTAGTNGLLATALDFSTSRTQTFQRDSSFQTLYVAAGASQTVYQPTDPATDIASTVYVFVGANASNETNSAIEVVFTSSSVDTKIARLMPGDFLYMPYRATSNHPLSSSLKVFNSSSAANYVTVLTAESTGSAFAWA